MSTVRVDAAARLLSVAYVRLMRDALITALSTHPDTLRVLQRSDVYFRGAADMAIGLLGLEVTQEVMRMELIAVFGHDTFAGMSEGEYLELTMPRVHELIERWSGA